VLFSGVLRGFAAVFLPGSAFFMLCPIRESMGIAAGANNLRWLFTATFLVMLAAVTRLPGSVPAHASASRRLDVRLLSACTC